ncbi:MULTISPECIES: hypothetical protein [unclassified Rhodococcus (in: high G+C Gram-positive bacteria)]|uniref:hypothetical protein n=1 Tax=unclassified Rhodococcus (in: high G+C Gram-positive bacteria) TaxID=192944 RepID=UPI001179BBEF|nr:MULTISPECIES: hypothetical protein [unclassified Rhodococcus (in: high G+C Gram-positive bacteria)]
MSSDEDPDMVLFAPESCVRFRLLESMPPRSRIEKAGSTEKGQQDRKFLSVLDSLNGLAVTEEIVPVAGIRGHEDDDDDSNQLADEIGILDDNPRVCACGGNCRFAVGARFWYSDRERTIEDCGNIGADAAEMLPRCAGSKQLSNAANNTALSKFWVLRLVHSGSLCRTRRDRMGQTPCPMR